MHSAYIFRQGTVTLSSTIYRGKRHVLKVPSDVTIPYYDKLIESEDSSELKIKGTGQIFKVKLLMAVKIML